VVRVEAEDVRADDTNEARVPRSVSAAADAVVVRGVRIQASALVRGMALPRRSLAIGRGRRVREERSADERQRRDDCSDASFDRDPFELADKARSINARERRRVKPRNQVSRRRGLNPPAGAPYAHELPRCRGGSRTDRRSPAAAPESRGDGVAASADARLVMSSPTTSRSSASASASATASVLPPGCDDRVAGGERRLRDVDAYAAARRYCLLSRGCRLVSDRPFAASFPDTAPLPE
jgi:hypothetical protein